VNNVRVPTYRASIKSQQDAGTSLKDASEGLFLLTTMRIFTMNTKAKIAAVAAIVTSLALPGIASAQQAIFYPPSYTWDQTQSTNLPSDAQGSVLTPARHRGAHTVRPYGQW
jgi:hypothetical protein